MAEKRDISMPKPNQLLRNLSDLHKEIYLLVTFYCMVIVIAFRYMPERRECDWKQKRDSS
jgi:hypothetical protein